MPQPAGRRSNCRAGKGLVISNSRNRKRARRAWRQSSGAAEQSDPLACHLVDDHEARVVAVAFAGGDGGGRNSERDGEGDACDQGEHQHGGLGVDGFGEDCPQEHSRHRSPGARPGLAQARSEKRGNGPGPEGFARRGKCGCGVFRGRGRWLTHFPGPCRGRR